VYEVFTRGKKLRDHELPMMLRRPGGLGLYLIERIMDKVEYQHR
jgi:anti-sigma regulatory factor (Ser/Thr protein kinase)